MPLPPWDIIKAQGLATWLAIFLTIAMAGVTGWIVRWVLKSSDESRKDHQKFFSESIGANTRIIEQVSERLSDVKNALEKINESLIRLETANGHQRQEHKDIKDGYKERTNMVLEALKDIK